MSIVYGPKWPFYSCWDYIGLLGTGFMQVLYLGRAPRTKETLPDFLKWRRVTLYPLVFRGLTGSQRTLGFWGVREFQDLFMGKYFLDTARHAKAQEFLELMQGTMNVMDYVARLTELARFADYYVAMDMAKVMRFEKGMKLSIQGRIVGLCQRDMDSMVGTALTIEREIEDARSTRDAGVNSKREES